MPSPADRNAKTHRKLMKKIAERPGGGKCRVTRARVEHVDYTDVATLQKLVSAQGKLYSRKRTGSHSHFQRKLKTAVKRARLIGLLPYVAR